MATCYVLEISKSSGVYQFSYSTQSQAFSQLNNSSLQQCASLSNLMISLDNFSQSFPANSNLSFSTGYNGQINISTNFPYNVNQDVVNLNISLPPNAFQNPTQSFQPPFQPTFQPINGNVSLSIQINQQNYPTPMNVFNLTGTNGQKIPTACPSTLVNFTTNLINQGIQWIVCFQTVSCYEAGGNNCYTCQDVINAYTNAGICYSPLGYDQCRVIGSPTESTCKPIYTTGPPNSGLIENPSAIYFYGTLNYDSNPPSFTFNGNIFLKANDGNFYNVYYYWEGSWYQNLIPAQISNGVVNNGLIYLKSYNKPSGSTNPLSLGTQNVDVSINLDLIGNGKPTNFSASELSVSSLNNTDQWFCKQLDGQLPNNIYYGSPVSSDLKNNCSKRGIA